MANVLSEEKKQQVLALGRLGWSLRRIQQATGIRRETAGGYLKAAGIAVRSPRGWGRGPAKPANEVITDFGGATPAKEVIADPSRESVSQLEVELGAVASRSPRASACEPYREAIELGLSRGRNAMAIWQDLVADCGFAGSYQSVQRFVHKLHGHQPPQARAVILTAPGEAAQVDYGSGPMVRDPQSGKYRRTRLFVMTLGYSRKSVRLLVWRSSARVWSELHERAFRRLGGAVRVVVLDNLREGVLIPDFYDPTLNPLYREVLAHYGAVAMPCRVQDPIARAKSSPALVIPRKLRSKGCASKAWKKPTLTWIAGSNAAPTPASMAPPNGKWRPCSPRKSQACCFCRSNPSAITSTVCDELTRRSERLLDRAPQAGAVP